MIAKQLKHCRMGTIHQMRVTRSGNSGTNAVPGSRPQWDRQSSCVPPGSFQLLEFCLVDCWRTSCLGEWINIPTLVLLLQHPTASALKWRDFIISADSQRLTFVIYSCRVCVVHLEITSVLSLEFECSFLSCSWFSCYFIIQTEEDWSC